MNSWSPESLWLMFRLIGILWHLTHWGQMMRTCVSNLTIFGSYNGLLPGWCQAINRTNGWLSLIGPSGANFSEILTEIHKLFCQENALENVWKIVAMMSQPQLVSRHLCKSAAKVHGEFQNHLIIWQLQKCYDNTSSVDIRIGPEAWHREWFMLQPGLTITRLKLTWLNMGNI